MCFFSHPTKYLSAAVILVVVPLAVAAQQADANIRGVILDQMGASVAKAKIVIASRSIRHELISDETGEFSSIVPVGAYQVTVESPGFLVTTLNRVSVQPSMSKTLKIVLKIRPSKYGKCPKGPPCIWL
ncbi:MAG TPA: carboxypeptidase-like regulatory domain-containing protein [Pyrinomonadaceae bacterium]|nr:carboxypeptidase-like regulatory domain-containing protein [Pyrinomonadaceae bacterium]